MTCLANGLRKLATRNSRLCTPGILPSQTIAQISIAQYNITNVEVKHPSTQTKTKEKLGESKSRFSSYQATTKK
jgi:hypothetical protein